MAANRVAQEINIYVIFRKSDGRAYAGKTKKPVDERVMQHYRNDKRGIGAAMRAEGLDKFAWSGVDTATCKREADTKECRYICLLNCLEPNGYNRKPGGTGRAAHGRGLRAKSKKYIKKEPRFWEIDTFEQCDQVRLLEKAKQNWHDLNSKG